MLGIILDHSSALLRVSHSSPGLTDKASLSSQLAQGIPSPPSKTGLRDGPTSAPNIYMSSGDPSSGSHVCIANGLTTKPSPKIFFLKQYTCHPVLVSFSSPKMESYNPKGFAKLSIPFFCLLLYKTLLEETAFTRATRVLQPPAQHQASIYLVHNLVCSNFFSSCPDTGLQPLHI